MTAKEIILANVNHERPPRPGVTFTRGRHQDMVLSEMDCFRGYQRKRWVAGKREYYDDFWGNLWVRMVDGCQGVVRYGPEEVLLRVDRRVLRLWGRDLRLVRLTPTGALVEGTLRGAEYLD